MKRGAAILFAAVCGIASGCRVSPPPRAMVAPTGIEVAAARSLDAILPRPQLPTTQPSTRPAPPLDAIELFARARAQLNQDQPFNAIAALEAAIALDPHSSELHYAMGQAQLTTNVAPERAIAAFTRAGELNPQNILPWMQLGRLATQRNLPHDAVKWFRLAMLTPDYAESVDDACLVDFGLGRALLAAGYPQAAADRFRLLLARLHSLGEAYYGTRELYQLLSRPEVIYEPLGDALAAKGENGAAADAYTEAAASSPASFELISKQVRALVRAERLDEAREAAARAVSRFRASDAAVTLLRESLPSGTERALIQQLSKLRDEKPEDLALSFALADALARNDRRAEAQAVLQAATERAGYEISTVRRFYDLHVQAGQLKDAARVLIVAASRRPQSLNECNAMMGQLLRLGRKNHLTLRDLQAIEVEPAAEAAKLYWVSRVADTWARDELARIALERAVRAGKPFAPAYRLLLGRYWARQDWDQQAKSQQSETLAILAEAQGSAALAAEVRGHAAAARKDLAAAAAHFEAALKLDPSQPDLQTAYAVVQIQRGYPVEGEQLLWEVTRTSPHFEASYSTLIRHYLDRGAVQSALRALGAWRQADPSNIDARLIESNIFMHSRRADLAEKSLLELFRDNSDNDQVLLAIQSLYAQSNRLGEFVTLLESDRATNPENRTVAERLVDLYAAQRRPAQARRVLEDLRASAHGDTDLLYYLSHQYMRIGDKKTACEVLEEVLRLEPRHTSASNDLGYFLADDGRELARAEKLVRQALADEPDNQAFLDSVAWVLYKRGKFAEAVQLLARAVAASIDPDPVVLDHYGDAAYRLGDKALALEQWRRAAQRLRQIGPARPDLRALGLQLVVKIQALGTGTPVSVAPIAEEPQTMPATLPATQAAGAL
jgi:predicted Zn-dependent protease